MTNFVTYNIIILGGNIAGVTVAHELLRRTIPALTTTNSGIECKVTLISPSDHTFYKVAAPRALMDVNSLKVLFASITDGFKDYPTTQFAFIKGEGIGVDESKKRVSVKIANKIEELPYSSLVVATGTTSRSPLWTLHGDHSISLSSMKLLNSRLVSATSILIAGAGAVGVETAGEIAYHFKPKSLALVVSGTALLPRLGMPSVSRTAESKLTGLGVDILYNVKLEYSTPTPNGQTSVTLSDGTVYVVDLFIDCTGASPNTTFLPEEWLDEKGRVITDTETLRATSASTDVYAIGDVASYSKRGIPDVILASPALAYSVLVDIHMASGSQTNETLKMKEKRYKQFKDDIQFVSIGPSGGVGTLFRWKVPSWFVWLFKSRTFFLYQSTGLANGKVYVKP